MFTPLEMLALNWNALASSKMAALSWPSKKAPPDLKASLILDSLVFPGGKGYPSTPISDQLLLGDNLAAMAALLPEYEGKFDLIYADPPFYTNRRYPARIGRGEDSRKPHDWQLAEGYADHWDSIEDYLDMLYPRLVYMHRLLSSRGSLYLHLDWHANAYARLLLDEIFGMDNLLNEIVWVYHGPSPIRSAFNRKHDTILAYTKSREYTFNAEAVRQPYDPNTIKTFEASPKAGFGKIPDLQRGKVPEDWWYFPVVARLHNERTGYPTQKPAALAERILLASSNPGDLVADFFCGSGTFPIAARRLGRRFVAADSAFRAIHTTRLRLLAESNTPFMMASALLQTPPGTAPGQASISDRSANPPAERPLFKRCGQEIHISPEWRARLDYWEIDPNWDGRVFRSYWQGLRRRDQEYVDDLIALPTGLPAEKIALRWVDIYGRQGLEFPL